MLLCQSTNEKTKDLGRFRGASPVAQRVKNPPAKQEMQVLSCVGKSPPTQPLSLEEGTAAHPSILAWRILWTEELGGGAPVHGVTESPTRLSTHDHRFPEHTSEVAQPEPACLP